MTCECPCHQQGMNFCVQCEKKHSLKESAGYLIDQKLEGFFVDRKKSGEVVNLIFQFEKATLVVSWDREKDTFKFTIEAA